ncbi:MAG: energy-coupling factor transporter ATP-binding protein EcfA2, partial [Verrucomicrobiales bacterium]
MTEAADQPKPSAGPDLPYPGLRPFREDESTIFFGRGLQISRMIGRLAQHRFLAVVGASGCGKSSLVKAGLIPALRQGGIIGKEETWSVLTMRPAGNPFGALAEAICPKPLSGPGDDDPAERARIRSILRTRHDGIADALLDSGTPVLLLVDQFEELFRHDHEGDADALFVNRLLAAAETEQLLIHVVITMRSDFIGDCDHFHGLPEAISESQFLTPRLTRDQTSMAITGPAKLFDGEIDEAVVTEILNEISDVPDQLPLMQHALMRAWSVISSLEKPRVCPKTWEAVGGLKNALNLHANAAWEEMTVEQEKITETLFRLLSERPPDEQLTRRISSLKEVADVSGAKIDEVRAVVGILNDKGRHFLILDESSGRLDISHEALLRQWERVDDWVEREAEDAEFFQDLIKRSAKWEKEKKQRWIVHSSRQWLYPVFSPELTKAFLWARVDSGLQKIRRAGHENDRQLILEAFYLGLTSGMLRLFFGMIWFVQHGEPDDSVRAWAERYLEAEKREESEREKIYRRSLGFLKQSSQTGLVKLSAIFFFIIGVLALVGMFFAIQEGAKRSAEQARTEAILHQAKTQQLLGDSKYRLGRRMEAAQAFHRSYRLLLEPGFENHPVKASSRALLAGAVDRSPPLTHEAQVINAHFSADGLRIVTASADNTARIWDAASGMLIGKPLAHEAPVNNAQFSADGLRVVTASFDHTARIWDAASGKPIGETLIHGVNVKNAHFSADGLRIVTASDDKTARVWNAASGKPIGEPLTHERWVRNAQFSEDGLRVVTASSDAARIWDAASGKPIGEPL